MAGSNGRSQGVAGDVTVGVVVEDVDEQSPEGTVVVGWGVVEDGGVLGAVVGATVVVDDVEGCVVDVVSIGTVEDGSELVEVDATDEDVVGSVVVGSVGGTVVTVVDGDGTLVVGWSVVVGGRDVVVGGGAVVEVASLVVVVDDVLVSGRVVVEATVEVVVVGVQPAGCVAVASSESVAPLDQIAEAWKVSVVSANVFGIVNTNGTSSGCDGSELTDHVSGRSASAVTV